MVDELGRLRWCCRRGMKELDVLLEKYLQTAYRSSSSSQKAAFEVLLATPDPELYAYLVGRSQPEEPELKEIIARIRHDHSS